MATLREPYRAEGNKTLGLELAEQFPAGSMGPKVEAACRFVESTGRVARIGSLEHAGEVLAGITGTRIE